MAVKICTVCGKQFQAQRNALYCTEQCRNTSRRGTRGRKKIVSPSGHYKRIAKNGNMKSIAEMDAKAKELGMSYGQYDAMLRMKEGTLYGKS